MPITLQLHDHPAKPWADQKVATSEELLEKACHRDFHRCEKIIQSSLSRDALHETHTSASENGFVWAAFRAYSDHHHLTIRPEDIWFAILTQLSFYINANSEKLRSYFVDHEGKKELEVIEAGTMDTVDFGALAERMTHMIAKNVKDPELRDWVMPSFSTTNATDKVVASVLFMGGMQKYFSYKMSLTCGIPSATLLGEVADYENILTRLDRLEQLGDEPTQFAEMLRPILRHMILSFTAPTSLEVASFWNKIATRRQLGSGMDYISGWIGAFCYWSPEGRATPRFKQDAVLDGVPYLSVDFDDVPTGIASVPVMVNDNGCPFECTMLAGSFGIQALSGAEAGGPPDGSLSVDSHPEPAAMLHIRPLSGWLMYQNNEDAALSARELEDKMIEKELKKMRELKKQKAEAAREEGESLAEPMVINIEVVEPAN